MALAGTNLLYIQQGASPAKATLDDIVTYVEGATGTVGHNAADTTALVGLTGISVGDQVYVADASGDAAVTTGWAIYRADVANPTTIAAGTGYRLITKEETLGVSLTVNLGYTAAATQGTVTNDSGNDSVIPAATTGDAGLMLPAQFDKLGFITVTQAVDLDNIEQDQIDLVSLSGVAANSANLGTFTGSIISDNGTIKAALQEVETDLEALQTASGIAAAATDYGTFTGTTIADNVTLKVALQSLETAVEAANTTDVTPLRTLSGTTAGDVNFGTFTGSIISDNSTAKVVMQELETDLEALQTATGIAAAATDLGAFTGTTIADNVTIKAALQAIETQLEAQAHNAVSELAGDNPIVVGGTGQELSFDISSLPNA